MKIQGKGASAIDADLLARLAVARGSGQSISKTELVKELSKVRTEMKSEFKHTSSGLTKAADAVANTLELAVKSGWIKGAATRDIVATYVDGKEADGLKALVKQVRADVRTYTPPRTVGT